MADSSSEVIGEDLKSGPSVTQEPSKDQAAVPTAEEVSSPTREDSSLKDPTASACSETSADCMEDSLQSQGEEPTEAATDDASVALASEEDPTDGGSAEAESRSEERSQSADSASFSVPSLVFSDGNNGNSPDEALSSSYSALGAEGQSPSVDLPCLGDEALGATAAASPPMVVGGPAGTGPDSDPALPAYYFVKWIMWKDKKTPIITQSENGPCPLLAIMNILFLRWQAKLPAQTEVITTEDLMTHLGECVLSIKPREKVQGMELNFQQNMSDAMAVLPKLSTGLDVNVRFTGVSDFEYTPECIVFDLLDIPLYHGWLVDPQSVEMATAVGKLSYNQLVEKIINYKQSVDSSHVSEALVAEQFLESTATQLSYHGLCELNTTAKEGELSVFFRNNHFSTMIKHKGHLYLLVTDQGFLQEEALVWESLHNVEGDGNFCDSDFRLCHPPQRTTPPAAPGAALTPQQQQQQIDQDYMVAMSLQQQQGAAPGPLSDLELARQLQQEEYQQQQQQQPPGGQPSAPQVRAPAHPAQQGGGQRRRPEKKDDSDCVIL
ncbi:ubiquitin carboxyl-terminal hydrolase MINDY-1 isoform X1 [Anguilla anguilla]|uniref:ubiquitin carboxyl-terminal hydrolase MINDY-1 isoform X1 n=2 Tax=Anguilla anguilla TaxID=7936 RepID=UPI0015B03AD7|nr:ubiquitin carboxyl-terminal hydrolase MINDY-1 isoform X1 [Anguilla anguilla]XP_035286011.1 ubiquitin carboxyl-terminal hydrolase MINDY-1 isoform X1 [Anguilla anguilla]